MLNSSLLVSLLGLLGLKVFVTNICLGYALTISKKDLPYPFDHPLPLLRRESGQLWWVSVLGIFFSA